ncbi:MAG: hypothetical protein HYX75_24185 [Acidobacteria bacterium]|nr:hypothetical protein [Acidobacteriota bacterium]
MRITAGDTAGRHFTACGSAYLVGLVVTGVPLCGGLYGVFRGMPGSWNMMILGILGYGVWCGWLGYFRLTIGKDTITYRALFRGTTSIALSQIWQVKYHCRPTPFKPTIRLEIEAQPGMGCKPILINLKVFSREARARLSELLDIKANSSAPGGGVLVTQKPKL